MNFYRQTIILFGAVIPIVIAVAVVALGYFMKTKMADSYAVKKESYETGDKARTEAAELEKKIGTERPNLERWMALLGKETASEIGINLREITEKLPDKEIQQTAFDPSSNEGSFGKASAENSSLIKIGFRGTYRTLQKALLELETKMPQLTLESMSLQPVDNSGYLLTFQVTYCSWEK